MCSFAIGITMLGLATRSGDGPEDWRSHVWIEAVARDADHEARAGIARAQAEGAIAALWLVGGHLPAPAVVEVRRPDPVFTMSAAAAQLSPLIEQWQDWSVIIMLRIGKCESGLDPSAIGGPNDDGLYGYGWPQIHGEPEALDPSYATERAHEKWTAAGGYSPWASSQRCWG